LGLVFESYGPIGEWRSEDLGGRPVETRAQFPDNSWRDSLDDLKDYIRQQRQAEFLDNVSRKLLTFALGRSLLLSDEPLIAELRQRGEANAFRFQGLVEQIVTSRQFLHKRGRQHDALARATAEETP
jgi:hypothetical protein